MSWQMQSASNTPIVRVKCILAIVIISCLSNNIPLLPLLPLLLMEMFRYSVTTHTALKLCSQLPKTVDTSLGLRSRLHPQGGPSTGQCLVQKQTTLQLPLIILSHWPASKVTPGTMCGEGAIPGTIIFQDYFTISSSESFHAFKSLFSLFTEWCRILTLARIQSSHWVRRGIKYKPQEGKEGVNANPQIPLCSGLWLDLTLTRL